MCIAFVVISKGFLPTMLHEKGHHSWWNSPLLIPGPLLEPIQYKHTEHLLCVKHCIHIVLRKAHISPAQYIIVILSSYTRK